MTQDSQLTRPSRTGFPLTCPIFNWTTTALRCNGCKSRVHSPDGTWSCHHPRYQQAPDTHFCTGCGIELGPWAERNAWDTCGGPVGQCLYVVHATTELPPLSPIRSTQ